MVVNNCSHCRSLYVSLGLIETDICMPPLGFLEDAVLQVQLAHGGMNGQERIHHETCYDFILLFSFPHYCLFPAYTCVDIFLLSLRQLSRQCRSRSFRSGHGNQLLPTLHADVKCQFTVGDAACSRKPDISAILRKKEKETITIQLCRSL